MSKVVQVLPLESEEWSNEQMGNTFVIVQKVLVCYVDGAMAVRTIHHNSASGDYVYSEVIVKTRSGEPNE